MVLPVEVTLRIGTTEKRFLYGHLSATLVIIPVQRGLSLECGDLSPLLVERHSTVKSGDKSPHSKERPFYLAGFLSFTHSLSRVLLVKRR